MRRRGCGCSHGRNARLTAFAVRRTRRCMRTASSHYDPYAHPPLLMPPTPYVASCSPAVSHPRVRLHAPTSRLSRIPHTRPLSPVVLVVDR
jgi:hypothetical protein